MDGRRKGDEDGGKSLFLFYGTVFTFNLSLGVKPETYSIIYYKGDESCG